MLAGSGVSVNLLRATRIAKWPASVSSMQAHLREKSRSAVRAHARVGRCQLFLSTSKSARHSRRGEGGERPTDAARRTGATLIAGPTRSLACALRCWPISQPTSSWRGSHAVRGLPYSHPSPLPRGKPVDLRVLGLPRAFRLLMRSPADSQAGLGKSGDCSPRINRGFKRLAPLCPASSGAATAWVGLRRRWPARCSDPCFCPAASWDPGRGWTWHRA
jgi:hypothetical protein